MPLRVDNVRQASIGTIAKMNDTLRNASHASAFATYRRIKCMGGAWKESKELDIRAQAFQLISIFNWKLDRESIDQRHSVKSTGHSDKTRYPDVPASGSPIGFTVRHTAGLQGAGVRYSLCGMLSHLQQAQLRPGQIQCWPGVFMWVSCSCR